MAPGCAPKLSGLPIQIFVCDSLAGSAYGSPAWIAVTLDLGLLAGWLPTHIRRTGARAGAFLRLRVSRRKTRPPLLFAGPSLVQAERPNPFARRGRCAFVEKTEMLANADVELRLTNRGAAISDAVLLNHKVGTNGQRVVLNGPDRIPIGAIVQQPDAPALAEYTVVRQADGSVQFEHKMPEGLTISKKFSFPPSSEAKDNYVVEMAIDFRNDGAQSSCARQDRID